MSTWFFYYELGSKNGTGAAVSITPTQRNRGYSDSGESRPLRVATPTRDLLAFNGVNSSADAVLATAFVQANSPRRCKCLFRRCAGIRNIPNCYIYTSDKYSTKSCCF